MLTVGIIGGMSWASSKEYYQIFNETIERSTSNKQGAHILLDSLDFSLIDRLQHEKSWGQLRDIMISSANKLKYLGADFIVIATNTMHRFADDIEQQVGIRVLHIVDVVINELVSRKLASVAILGTRFTVESKLYEDLIAQKSDVKVVSLSEDEIEMVHRIIYDELIFGELLVSSKDKIKALIANVGLRGADGIILGCTELPLLIHYDDVELELLDTLQLHAQAAAHEMMR